MVMEFNTQDWQHGRQASREPGSLVRPDWEGLYARLLAARQMRRALAHNESGSRQAAPSGSFDSVSARWVVASGHDSVFVNSTDSANRNAGGAMETRVAVVCRSGDRG